MSDAFPTDRQANARAEGARIAREQGLYYCQHHGRSTMLAGTFCGMCHPVEAVLLRAVQSLSMDVAALRIEVKAKNGGV